MTVCKQVEDNGDADHAQGGTFGFTISDQSNTLGSPSLTRIESQSANAPVCSAPISVPGSSTILKVAEAVYPPTSTWPRNEGGYPVWTATNGTNTLTGSGNAPADISTLSGDVTITFSNRAGRTLTLCKLVEPNSIAPNNQGDTWGFNVQFEPSPGITAFPITAGETSGAVCLPPINIPVGTNQLRISEGVPFQFVSFPGYPKYAWTTTGGQSDTTGLIIPMGTTSGDVTVTITNKYDEPHVLNVCNKLLGNGDATNDSGDFTFMASLPELAATSFWTPNVAEGGSTVCSTLGSFNIPSAYPVLKVGSSLYPSNWPGNAIGYPQWEVRNNITDALLASGTGDYTTVDFAALGTTNVKVVMINKAGTFGNGSDPTTGKIMRICKKVDNNGDAVDDAARFGFVGLEFGGFYFEHGFGGIFDKTVKESDGLVCDRTVAVQNIETEFQIKEQAVIDGWPGHAPGYPNWEVLSPTNTALQSGLAVRLDTRYSLMLAAQINTTAIPGDSTFIMHNKAGTRKLTMCVNVMDNGFAPTDSAEFELYVHESAAQFTPVVSEGGSSCVTYGAPSSSIQSLEIYIPSAPWPGFAYGFPNYSYTTSGGGSGSGVMTESGPYFLHPFDFANPADAGDITFNINVKPARRLTVCKQLLNNGDGIDNSGTFTINRGGNRDLTNVNLTATEGGSIVCSSTLGVANYGYPTQVIAQELSLPINWPGNTPGFPLFNWTTTGGQSGTGSGNSATFDLSNTPDVSGIENTTGDITVTFFNRTGPPRTLTLCKDVEDNGDSTPNQGGVFTMTGGGNTGTPGSFPLTQTEGQPRVCSPPITIDPLSTTISALETAPGTWPGNAFGFPQWTLLDGANATVTSGIGTATSNLLLSSFTGNPTIVFRNRAILSETGSCTAPPSGIISWWRGEGNAVDSKGGNDGTLVGGVTYAAGKVGNAFQFDGVDDHVLVPNSANLNFGTGDFSLEAWVKTSFIGGSGNKLIVSKMSVGQDIQYALAYQANTDGKALFIMGDGTTSVFALSPTSIADGLFHHLVGVRQGLNLKLYIDGALAASAPMPSLYSATGANNVVIGGKQDSGNTPYFNGLIDEVSIYNRALTDSEILSIALAGSGGKCFSTPPTITCPGNIMVNNDPGQCSASVSFNATATGTPAPTITCRVGAMVITSPNTFPVGATTVNCTASNGTLPDATCSFTVTVLDTQAPTVTCPANITTTNAANQCGAVVNYTTPSASDNCSGATVTCAPASGTSFARGVTTVTCTAKDASNNMAACTFTVTVTDNQPPAITCPANIALNTAPGICSAVATYTTPTPTDNCPGATAACVPASGSTFQKGVTTVTCTATDASNNTAACTFTVTVTDNQNPTITCPANQTAGSLGGPVAVTYPAPTATDNCPGVTTACVPVSGSAFPVGTTTVNCTATDAVSRTATCSFTVTVAVSCLAITCPADISVGTTGNSTTVTYTLPTANGNCGTITCLPASGSTFNVGTTTVSCSSSIGNQTCAFRVAVNRVSGTLSDPLACTGSGNTVQATLAITNNGNVNQNIVDATTFTNLVGVPGSCTVSPNVGTCTVTNSGVSFTGTLTPGQTVAITYLTQVSDLAPTGAQVCTNNSVTFNGGPPLTVSACTTVTCPASGPGGIFPATSEASDQTTGSVLIYNVFTSGATSGNTQNTRINITNTHPQLPAFVHLFFVAEGCSIADSYVCLTANQTASFLASDLDPGTTGYLVAVAVNSIGCPTSFNYLIGDEYVKFTSGHAANLGAEAFSALAGGLPACDGNSVTAQLNFDGVSYNRMPALLALDSVGSRADGNDTLLIVNRIGGNLGIGASTLGTLFGLMYDDAENALSFNIAGSCQLRNSISNNFPRTTPRFETFIPAGRTGWLKVFNQTGAIGITGAAINFNANAGASAGAFTQGHNLHVLTLTNTASYIIPIFPPSC